MSVEKTCSFSVILTENCRPNTGEEKIIFRRECVYEIGNQLRRCHLSRENLTKIDLILARTGPVDLGANKVTRDDYVPKTQQQPWQVLAVPQDLSIPGTRREV